MSIGLYISCMLYHILHIQHTTQLKSDSFQDDRNIQFLRFCISQWISRKAQPYVQASGNFCQVTFALPFFYYLSFQKNVFCSVILFSFIPKWFRLVFEWFLFVNIWKFFDFLLKVCFFFHFILVWTFLSTDVNRRKVKTDGTLVK